MQEQNEIPKPTVEGFREFLTSQPEDKVVGYTGNSSNCPFLNYLKTLSPYFVTVVGKRYRYRNTEEGINKEIEAEAWIPKFVDKVDNHHHFGGAPVTAKQALEVLNKVIAEIS